MTPQSFHFLRIEHNISYSSELVNSCLNFKKTGSNYVPVLNKGNFLRIQLAQLKAIKQLERIRSRLKMDKGLEFENRYESIFNESLTKGKLNFLKILYKTLVFIIISDHPASKILLKTCQEIIQQYSEIFKGSD
jgi:hypothetical protein